MTRLLRHAEVRALQARALGTVRAIRAWALLETLLSSGLRAPELAALQIWDCLPYRASGNDLEVVQEQLGHASIKTTTIYAKVTKEDKVRAAEALAKAYRSSQQNRESGASRGRRAQMGVGIR